MDNIEIDKIFEGLAEDEAAELNQKIRGAVAGAIEAHRAEKDATNQEKLKAEFLAELKGAQAKGYRGLAIKEIKAKFMRRGLDFGKIDFTV